MIHQISPRRAIFVIIIGVSFLLTIDLTIPFTLQNDCIVANNQSTYDIDILLLLDHQYGRSYFAVRQLLEQYGWNITTTSVNPVLAPCPGMDPSQVLTVDVLIQNITDITNFDCISVMAGVGHPFLVASQETLDLIKTAAKSELIVSGWCTGVRILAAADVIRGRNVTGSKMYREEYEAAGAAYTEDESPIIDGNIVTVGRSRYYRDEMGCALATALGVYESNPPVIESLSITPETANPYSQVEISALIIEESGVLWIKAKFYNQSDGERELEPSLTLMLINLEDSSSFVGNTKSLGKGNFSVDLQVKDIFDNYAVYTDVCSVKLIDITSDLNGQFPFFPVISIILGMFISILALIIVVLRRRSKN